MLSTVRLANDAWEALLEAHAALLREFLAEDLWGEISMREYDVLYALAKSARPVRIGDLQDHVLLSQPALSRMVDRLVGRDLIQRTPDPSDGRGVLVTLSEAGREMQRVVGRRHARHVAAAMTERLEMDQLAQLEGLSRRLAGRLRGQEDQSS